MRQEDARRQQEQQEAARAAEQKVSTGFTGLSSVRHTEGCDADHCPINRVLYAGVSKPLRLQSLHSQLNHTSSLMRVIEVWQLCKNHC